MQTAYTAQVLDPTQPGDNALLDELRDGFDRRVGSAEQAAYGVIGKQINLGSPKQLQVVLFDELQMPKTRKLKSGYTTDAEALERVLAQYRQV